MWKNVSLLVVAALALAWGGEAGAADVELTRAGNDPQNVWCDTGARQLAQGATLNVQILGRKTEAGGSLIGKIRMKSQTDKFEWASGEPTVTFTWTGSSPTSFGVKAKTTAPVGTYSIQFAGVDARNSESSKKSCRIEVTPAPAVGTGGRILPGRPVIGEPPISVNLIVSPPSGATSLASVTLRAVASGGPPEIERPGLTPTTQCQYKAIPTAGGEQRESQWDVGCLGWTTTLVPGTYTLQATYRKMDMRMSTDYYAQVTNYVVWLAQVLTLPDTTPKRLAETFSLKLGIAPASGQATSDRPLTIRLFKEGTWNPSGLVCSYAAIPTAGGNPWSVGPDSACGLPNPTLVAGTYTVRLSYRYQKPDGSWGEGSSEVANYVVVPGVRLVEAALIRIDPQQPATGQEVTARMTIKNSGARDLANVPWWILFNETTIGNGVQASLARGGSVEVTGRWTLRTAGTLRVVGLVDPLNTLGEPTAAQGDNRKEFQVSVAQGSTPSGGTGLLPIVTTTPSATPAAPQTPRIVDVRYVVSAPLFTAKAEITVCNVDPDAAYEIVKNGNFLGRVNRAVDFPRFSSSLVPPCPAEANLRVGLVAGEVLGVTDCCTTITYQVVAVKGNGRASSNSAQLRTLSDFNPCPLVPVCTKVEGK